MNCQNMLETMQFKQVEIKKKKKKMQKDQEEHININLLKNENNSQKKLESRGQEQVHQKRDCAAKVQQSHQGINV